MGGFKKFRNQDYDKLRKHHQDLGVPWKDPLFPSNETSLGENITKKLRQKIVWKRPSDISENPRLFVDGASRYDANQGELGNCWFVAACSVLAGSKPLWENVIPDWKNQEWSKMIEYSGVFRFRFWSMGEWYEVVIDDLLPTIDGNLIFSHSNEHSEFWGALLEKAYAKFHGTYSMLDGGNLSDALVDLTGGVSEIISIDDKEKGYRTDNVDRKKSLYKIMASDLENHALMCCAIKKDDSSETEQKSDLGLVKGHAYGITGMRKIFTRGTGFSSLFMGREKLYLIRLQNPWGKSEWTGPFSDTGWGEYLNPAMDFNRVLSRSPEWSNVSKIEREKLGLTFEDDGEFWMPFDDFLHQFDDLSICRVINTSLFSMAKTWKETHLHGKWIVDEEKSRAGGCINNKDTFLLNPQYKFDISKENSEVIFQLTQKDVRGNSITTDDLFTIGFHVMQVESNRKYRVHENQKSIVSSEYVKSKHVFLKTTLDTGRYILMPTTFEPKEENIFLMRMYTEDKIDAKLIDEDEPVNKWWQFFSKKPAVITRINIKAIEGLKKQEGLGKLNPYCIVNCEGQKFKTEIVYNNTNPTWSNASFVFYRKSTSKPIIVDIWNSNMVMDSFVGRVTINTSINEPFTVQYEIYGRNKKANERLQGKAIISVESYSNLSQI